MVLCDGKRVALARCCKPPLYKPPTSGSPKSVLRIFSHAGAFHGWKSWEFQNAHKPPICVADTSHLKNVLFGDRTSVAETSLTRVLKKGFRTENVFPQLFGKGVVPRSGGSCKFLRRQIPPRSVENNPLRMRICRTTFAMTISIFSAGGALCTIFIPLEGALGTLFFVATDRNPFEEVGTKERSAVNQRRTAWI